MPGWSEKFRSLSMTSVGVNLHVANAILSPSSSNCVEASVRRRICPACRIALRDARRPVCMLAEDLYDHSPADIAWIKYRQVSNFGEEARALLRCRALPAVLAPPPPPPPPTLDFDEGIERRSRVLT